MRHIFKKLTMKRVLFALLMVFILYICASFAFTIILFNIVFGRNELKEHEIALNYSDIDSTRYPRSTVRFPSDSNNLQGYIYNNSDEATGLILIAHGIASGADSYLPETMYFVDANWCVFAFDGTGTRESEGGGIRGLPQTKLDLRAALDYIDSNNELTDYPIMLYGQSMGGYATTAILADNRDDIEAVVAVSAFNSPLDVMHWHSSSMVGGFANLFYPFIWIYNSLLFGNDANITAVDGINATDIPIMIVYGTDDDVVPFDTIGIPAYRDKITNPNALLIQCDADYRNQHDTVHLRQDAAMYLLEKREELSALNSQYNNNIPDSVWLDFIHDIDSARMNEIDDEFMQTVLTFFNQALGGD